MTESAAEYLRKPYGRLLMPEEDGTYRAEILEFPGCFAVGETAAEAAENLENAASSWIESNLARGKAVPEPMEENEYSGKFVVRLPKSLHRRAAYAANRENVSLNQFIVASIAEQVGGYRWSIFNNNRMSMYLTLQINTGAAKTQLVTQNFERQIATPLFLANLSGPAHARS